MPAVRNIRGLGGTKPIPVYVFIPPNYGALHKITVTRADGTTDNITDIIFKGTVKDSVNENIGNFSFIIDNSSEAYTNVWTGNEIVRFYCDYATSATTLRFRGRIEKVSYPNNTVKIVGRSEALNLLNLLVTYSTTGETSAILKSLFDNFATDYTYTNASTSTTTMTVNWYQKPMLECIVELCNKSGFDFYIDCNLDAHYFESGSVKNTTEAAVHGSNILSIDDFGRDLSLVRNKVTVQGTDLAGLLILWTESSTDATYGINSALGVRHKIIADENVNSVNQAESRAEAELAVALEPVYEGEAECIELATIQPGEQIKVSAPYSSLPPNSYTINSFEHDIVKRTTRLNINKIPLDVQNIIKRTKQWGALESASKPSSYDEYASEMEYSWNIGFSSDSGSHSDTEISGGFLKTDGSASGIWESDFNEIDANASAVVLRVKGEKLSPTKIFVSLDGGTTYRQIYGENVPAVQVLTSGSNLKLRVYFGSADTEIEGLSLLYK